jgi:hypothetical protein
LPVPPAAESEPQTTQAPLTSPYFASPLTGKPAPPPRPDKASDPFVSMPVQATMQPARKETSEMPALRPEMLAAGGAGGGGTLPPKAEGWKAKKPLQTERKRGSWGGLVAAVAAVVVLGGGITFLVLKQPWKTVASTEPEQASKGKKDGGESNGSGERKVPTDSDAEKLTLEVKRAEAEVKQGNWEEGLRVAVDIDKSDRPDARAKSAALREQALTKARELRNNKLDDAKKPGRDSTDACELFKKAYDDSKKIASQDKQGSEKLPGEVVDAWVKYGRGLKDPKQQQAAVRHLFDAIEHDRDRVAAQWKDANDFKKDADDAVEAMLSGDEIKGLIAEIGQNIESKNFLEAGKGLVKIGPKLAGLKDDLRVARQQDFANRIAAATLRQAYQPGNGEKVLAWIESLDKLPQPLQYGKFELMLARAVAYLHLPKRDYANFLLNYSEAAKNPLGDQYKDLETALVKVADYADDDSAEPATLKQISDKMISLRKVKASMKGDPLVNGLNKVVAKLVRSRLDDKSFGADEYKTLLPYCAESAATGTADSLTRACYAECLLLQHGVEPKDKVGMDEMEDLNKARMATSDLEVPPEMNAAAYTHYVKAVVLNAEGDKTKAVGEYQKAFSVGATAKPWQTTIRRTLAADASFQLGKANQSNMKTQDAFDDFAFAFKIHPAPPHSYKAKYVEAAGALGHPDFIEFFEDCLKDDPLEGWSKDDMTDVGRGFVAWGERKANRTRAEQMVPKAMSGLKAIVDSTEMDRDRRQGANLLLGAYYWKNGKRAEARPRLVDALKNIKEYNDDADTDDDIVKRVFRVVGTDSKNRLDILNQAIPANRTDLQRRHGPLLLYRLNEIIEGNKIVDKKPKDEYAAELLKADLALKAPIYLADVESLASLCDKTTLEGEAYGCGYSLNAFGWYYAPAGDTDAIKDYEKKQEDYARKLEEVLSDRARYNKWNARTERAVGSKTAEIWAGTLEKRYKATDPKRAEKFRKILEGGAAGSLLPRRQYFARSPDIESLMTFTSNLSRPIDRSSFRLAA